MMTGRSLLMVARESYALTYYTFWHLEQWREMESIRHQNDRYDMAALLAHAFHQPGKLEMIHQRWLGTILPIPTLNERQEKLDRAMRHVRAHQTMIPTEPH